LLNKFTPGLLRYGLLVLPVLLLVACGFHLRGPVQLPPALKETRIVGVAEYAALNLQLKKLLTNAGAKVLPASSKVAPSTISISNEVYEKRVLSVDSQGRASEYGLLYAFHFEVSDEAGKVLVAAQKIELVRDYRFDPNTVLAMDSQEAKIKADMIDYAARQLIRRVDATLKPKT
jgi:LPS-assembly lipoprotein